MYFEIAKTVIQLIFRKSKPVLTHLKRHFGCSPDKFPIAIVTFSKYRKPCVAVALRAYLKRPGRRGQLLGIANYDSSTTLNDLLHPDRSEQQLEGPIQYGDTLLANGRSLSYPEQGLYLIRDGADRLAVFVSQGSTHDDNISIEIIARKRSITQKFISELKLLVDSKSIFKGNVLSLVKAGYGPPAIVFKPVRKVERDDLILPEPIIDQIAKHTTLFTRHYELMRATSLHLKRGLLLYGPPGTGKTLTMMHIISRMPNRTTILVNGSTIEYLEEACTLARTLQPATVIIDDVDLVAEERSKCGANKVLFQLLNEMDGVSEDTDILFMLSTNKPEVLEPALASRPGRIDQAILIPLPDEACRHRLFKLYGKNFAIGSFDVQKLVEATDGASGAYIRELFRRAFLLAAEEAGGDKMMLVEDRHFEGALMELNDGGPLLGKLLAYGSAS
jgi:hypothetical protein